MQKVNNLLDLPNLGSEKPSVLIDNILSLWPDTTTKNTSKLLLGSVADPDPKDLHHFAGSGSIIFSMDPDPDQNLAHFHHLSPPPSHLIFYLSLRYKKTAHLSVHHCCHVAYFYRWTTPKFC